MRRSRMTTIATIAAAVSFGSSAASRPTPHPNIVYIISDDQGWKDVGYHGSDIKIDFIPGAVRVETIRPPVLKTGAP